MTWEPINLASPDFEQPSEPPAVSGLLYKGKRHALSGAPEDAKTLTAFILSLEHMRAGHGPVAIVDFEMGPTATRRMLKDLGATADEIRSILYFEPDGPPDLADIEAIEKHGVRHVTIDALVGAYGVSDLNDNDRGDAERFGRVWIEPFYVRGISTLALDHVVKDPEKRGKYSIGSERKLGVVDVHLGIDHIRQLSRGTTGRYRITTHKDRPGWLPRPRAAELELASDPDTHAISWAFTSATTTASEDGPWRPTVLMQRVLAYLAQQAEPVNRATIKRDIGGKAEYVVQAIGYLLLDEKIVEVGSRRLLTLADQTTNGHLDLELDV